MAGLLGIVVFGVVARTGDTEIGLMELELLVESDALDLLFDSVGFNKFICIWVFSETVLDKCFVVANGGGFAGFFGFWFLNCSLTSW